MTKAKQLESSTDKIIIQITDTHLLKDPKEEFVQVNPEHGFHAVMDDIRKNFPHIDAIIHTGDLAQNAKTETYQRYLDYMQQFAVPFFQVPGNHDDIEKFPFATALPEPTVVDLGAWQIILLNSAVTGKIDGWFDHEHLERLDTLLENNQDRHVILACHHHPFSMHSKWIDQHILKNTTDLKQILSKYNHVKLVVFGHVHQESVNAWHNTEFLSTPSTFVQFKPRSDDFAFDDIAPGYRCLHLKSDGQYSTKVYRLKDYNPKINKEISGY